MNRDYWKRKEIAERELEIGYSKERRKVVREILRLNEIWREETHAYQRIMSRD